MEAASLATDRVAASSLVSVTAGGAGGGLSGPPQLRPNAAAARRAANLGCVTASS
jgi:hypothetical protein